MIPWLRPGAPFPPVETALDDPNGLLAASERLEPDRLKEAYRRGIFPWYSEGQPVLWWSPDPRFVLFVDEFRLARFLAQGRRAAAFRDPRRHGVSHNRDRMRRDAAPRAGWHVDHAGRCRRLQRAARRGCAHSVEAWREGRLVGGLYGVSMGRMFFGESMFACETDASKVALAHLMAIARARQIPLVDCQQETGHLASLGARPIPRAEFARRVATLVNCAAPEAPWHAPPVEDVLR